MAGISSNIKSRWFWIGLLPTTSGLFIAAFAKPVLFDYDYLIMGVAIWLIVVTNFKNKATLPPTHLRSEIIHL
jgi:hypothetical protein